MDCQIKDIQKNILDIFIQIDKVCIENNINYYAIGGTCLGAVRHQGFIPWDDDLDIAMPRDDYERFKKIASKELPTNLKIFDADISEHYVFSFMKVHNVNTTFIEKGMSSYPDRYTGVYVDIMPLDGIPNGKFQRKKYFFQLKLLGRLNRLRKYAPSKNWVKEDEKIKGLIGKMVYLLIKHFPINYFQKKYVELQKKYTYCEAIDLCYTWSSKASKIIFPKSDFEKDVLLPFENIQIRCPIGYDNFLTTLFGDYMELPPVEKRVPCHKTDILDLDRPYSYYIKKRGREQ